MQQQATPEQIAGFFLDRGTVKPADIERTRALADESATSLGLMMTRVGLVSDSDLAGAYAKVLDYPLLRDDDIPLAPPEDLKLKESFLREVQLLLLKSSDDEIELATADPENRFALDALRLATRKNLNVRIATVSQVEQTLDRWFGDAEAGGASNDSVVDYGPPDTESIDRLRDLASQAPVIRFVNLLLQQAIETDASDIHIEPVQSDLRVRFRVDGMLRNVETAPNRIADAVVSRIKLMAKMNIAERRLPQDGRANIRIQGTAVDLRVSTIPTVDGESIVLRVLDQQRDELELGSLGFGTAIQSGLEKEIRRSNGILLVTGPTGSGKTTTLYSLLKLINTTERKLVTIEDPVEYQLEGVNQVQVKPAIGLDFAHALRSIVRQDPDVIMVGEMRDQETARTAVQSALTGHLVLSTLHTNDAGSSITRLLDMGIEDYLVTSSVNAILAQRLVRRLCDQCRTGFEPQRELLAELGLDGSDIGQLHRAEGCEACAGTGYRGRTVISELLTVDDAIRRAILEGADGKRIQQIACDSGMRSLANDGLDKAIEGQTTIEEISRVTHTV